MDELISKYIPKSAPSDHPWNTSGLIVIGVFMTTFLLIGVILSDLWIIKILCLLLIPIVIILGLMLIRQVEFDKEIAIKPILGKTKSIKYNKLKKFYKHYLGKHGMYIWIIEYQDGSRLKKLTFYDDNLNYEEFKVLLNKLINEHNTRLAQEPEL